MTETKPHYGDYATILLDKHEKKAVEHALNLRTTKPSHRASEIIVKINANYLGEELRVFLAKRLENKLIIYKVTEIKEIGEVQIDE